jgi:hypothetical protein
MGVTIANIVERWSGLEQPLFKGQLIDAEGCKCAQGDVLSCAGWTDQQLRELTQGKADVEVAKVLGISRTHAILLRHVNDKVGGAPQLVLSHPEQILGEKAPLLLAFWLYMDAMPDAAWDAAWAAAWDAAAAAARAAAWDAAAAAARAAARAAAGAAAWAVAANASTEIQGMDILERDGKQPYFLAFFRLKTWDDVRALVPQDSKS